MNENFIDEKNKIKDAFEFFDSDKDGYIDQKDIRIFLNNFQFDYNESHIIEFIKIIDLDKNTKINYEDFEKLMSLDYNMTKEKKIEEFDEFFKFFDRLGDHKLAKSDFAELLKKLGKNLFTEEEINNMMEVCNTYGDNFVDLNEFKKMILN